ncbi:MAG: SusC/RagA family TonB-linked outer membrane protein [Bacteroidota bacterium]
MKRIALLLIFTALSVSAVWAQTRITGRVTGADDGSPLPGVSVVIEGTTIGTVTAMDGTYTIMAAPEQRLVFSFIGMRSQIISVGTSTVIDIVMETDVVNMDEVLVIGYGTSTKEANTGAVAVVKDEDIRDVPEMSFEKMLTGKVAGVQVTSQSGQPGSSTEIRIRGTSSLNAGNEPLYVVDGIPVMDGNQSVFSNTGNALAMINPNDIASISILKDAAAASVYGSRAANGVILITTKSGKEGESKINFKATYGVTSLANDNHFGAMTPEQYLQYKRDAVRNAGFDPDDPMNGNYYVPTSLLGQPLYNWEKELIRYGSINEYELSVTGGNENTRHFTSGLYSKANGIFHGIDYRKYQFRSNIDHNISTRMKMGVKINLFHQLQNDIAMQDLYFTNPLFASTIIEPWVPPTNPDGTYNMDIPINGNTNPLCSAAYDEQSENQNRLQGSFYFEWEPLTGLKFKTSNAAEYVDGEGRYYWSPEANVGSDPTLQTSRSRYYQLTSSNTLSYSKYFNNQNFSLLAGFEAIDNYDNVHMLWAPGVDANIPYSNTVTSDNDDADYFENHYTMASFFGILDYSYDNKYYLRASIRSDGSSKFGANNRWGTFYSVGLSWNMHNESFLENVNAINLLKLRASYGINGNDRIGTYEQWGVYSPVAYNSRAGMAPAQPNNPDLTWEENSTYNLAVDFGLFKRITGSIEVYNRLTTDMLLDLPISRTSGFLSLRQNIGSLRNKGIEGMINVTLFDGEFKWDAGINLAHNRSEILDLGGDQQIIDNRLIHRVGEKLYNYYLFDYAGVDPVNGEALWYDSEGKITNIYTSARRVIAGSPEPELLGGFSTDLSWKGISFSAGLELKYGCNVLIEELHYLYSDGYLWGANQVNTSVDYWKEPGDITRNPKPIADNSTNSNGWRNMRYMFDGSYLRLKNLTLSYTIPESLTSSIGIEQLRIYGSAVNAFTWHNVDFWDPERGVDGQGFGIYPMTKSFVVGLDLTF